MFLSYQTQIFNLIGYNLEFFTPFETLEAFKEHFWRGQLYDLMFQGKTIREIQEIKNTPDFKIKREIIEKFFRTAHMLVIDSAITPMSLYFEQAEIAAACIGLAHKLFMTTKHDLQNSYLLHQGKILGYDLVKRYFGFLDEALSGKGFGLDIDFREDFNNQIFERPKWF